CSNLIYHCVDSSNIHKHYLSVCFYSLATTVQSPSMRFGKNVIISGNINITAMPTRSTKKKGVTPLKTTAEVRPMTEAAVTNTFRPTGGVIRPSSIHLTTRIANHTPSKDRKRVV